MLKRLSYPLSWVEGLTGEGAPGGSQADSLPTSAASADSNNSTSVFSKVFNRYARPLPSSLDSIGTEADPGVIILIIVFLTALDIIGFSTSALS